MKEWLEYVNEVYLSKHAPSAGEKAEDPASLFSVAGGSNGFGGGTMTKRESLLNLRTCREIVTGMDLARSKKLAPTMFQRMRRIVARGTEEVSPHVNEATLALELDKERRRFKRRLQTVERSQAKILGFRRKLAATHQKNSRIMDLRLELQRQYWKGTSSIASKTPDGDGPNTQKPSPKFKVKRLRYGGKS